MSTVVTEGKGQGYKKVNFDVISKVRDIVM